MTQTYCTAVGLVLVFAWGCSPRPERAEGRVAPAEAPPGSAHAEIDAATRPDGESAYVSPLAEVSIPGSMGEVCRLVEALPPWKSVGEEDWDLYIDTAMVLQWADPSLVRIALNEYVLHFSTSWDPEVSAVDEHSKAFLLLRVMFDLPQTPDESEPYGVGAWWVRMRPGAPDISGTESFPILWTQDGPMLTAGFAGYSGASYDAGREFAYFCNHFKYRTLRSKAKGWPNWR